MKITFAALSTAMVSANSHNPIVQEALNIFGIKLFESNEEKRAHNKADTEWYSAGIKGYYDGFYRSFYKTELPEANKKCLDNETIENIVDF